MQIQYLVLVHGAVRHIPQAVQGRSGKTYGAAVWLDDYQAHVLRIDQATWEGPNRRKGAGMDISAKKRLFTKISVMAIPIPDADSPEQLLAEENDRLKRANEALADEVLTLRQFLSAGAPPPAAAQQQPLPSEQPPAEQPPIEPAAGSGTGVATITERLLRLPYRVARAIGKDANALGAKIDLFGNQQHAAMAAVIEAAVTTYPQILDMLQKAEAEAQPTP